MCDSTRWHGSYNILRPLLGFATTGGNYNWPSPILPSFGVVLWTSNSRSSWAFSIYSKNHGQSEVRVYKPTNTYAWWQDRHSRSMANFPCPSKHSWQLWILGRHCGDSYAPFCLSPLPPTSAKTLQKDHKGRGPTQQRRSRDSSPFGPGDCFPEIQQVAWFIGVWNK